MRKSLLKGVLFQVAGATLLVLGLLFFMFVFPRGSQKSLAEIIFGDNFLSFIVPILAAFASALSLAVGKKLYNYGRRHRAPIVSEAMLRDKPYVLYLRSFESETITEQIPDEEWNQARPPMRLSTEEERLTKAFRHVGQGVAVGRPGDPLPPLGFYRLYLADHEWRDEVEKLMTKARLVVLRIGNSDGLLWEMNKARELLAPERLVLVVPADSGLVLAPGQLNSWPPPGLLSDGSKKVKLLMGVELPVFEGLSVLHKTSVAGIIYFESDWTPRAVPLNEFNSYSFKQAMERALEPVYKRLGVRLGLRAYKLFPPVIVYPLALVGLIILFVRDFNRPKPNGSGLPPTSSKETIKIEPVGMRMPERSWGQSVRYYNC